MNIARVLIIASIVLFVQIKTCLSAKWGEKCKFTELSSDCERDLFCYEKTLTCLKINWLSVRNELSLGESCIHNFECDRALEFPTFVCDTRLNKLHVCTDYKKVYGQTCVDECVPNEEIYNERFKKCNMHYHKLCKENADCTGKEECDFDDFYGYAYCEAPFEMCTWGKCPHSNEMCANGDGIAKCVCRFPNKGTPPNCNMNCGCDSDCYTDFKCRKGTCVGACDGVSCSSGKICVINWGRAECIRPAMFG